MAARELTLSSWELIKSVHSEMVLSSWLHVLLLNKSTEIVDEVVKSHHLFAGANIELLGEVQYIETFQSFL